MACTAADRTTGGGAAPSSSSSTTAASVRINIKPEVWKDAWWDQMASSMLTYPKNNPSAEVISDTRNTIIGIRTTLPCAACRENWRQLLVTNPPTNAVLSGRDAYAQWFCDCFRSINKTRSHLSNDDILTYYARRMFTPNVGVHKTITDHKLLIIVGIICVGLLAVSYTNAAH